MKKQRFEYLLNKFDTRDALADPFQQFRLWYEDATKVYPDYSNAMILSTSGQDGRPSSRVVLLKDFDDKGFVFFTNYNSKKGEELSANPYCSLLFFWPDCQRQVRIEGVTEKLSPEESSEYFATRPRESQIAALVSAQSEKIPDREALDKMFEKISSQYEGQEIPRPAYWGGYILKPYYFEFWQGRANRLNDRITYSREGSAWEMGRLAP